ncbi:leucine-rich repeat protein SHOC-2-like isoform X2 [Watersipora subatra]|uniref:leucine-rich repeat protein SHOC-2-like isoform X2 n=1 Tax=Watersipora subatra TaxID=2589382 RepID=UPI00355B9BA2
MGSQHSKRRAKLASNKKKKRDQHQAPSETELDKERIVTEIGVHHITHMYLEGGIVELAMTPHLKELRLNAIPPADLVCFSSLTGLEILDLSYMNMPDGLPHEIGQLSSLERLSLQHCRLTDLPQSFSCLCKLRELDLTDNMFSEGLPISIGHLRTLEHLLLDACNLTDLPECLSHLTDLKLLHLNYNHLDHGLPDVIQHFSLLETLSLKQAGLADLPLSFSSLTSLKELELSFNDMRRGLPPVIGQLSTLEKLMLEKCCLTDLPQSLSSLERLAELELSSNDFSAGLPSVIGQMKGLQKIRLIRCQLRDLPQRLDCETQLKVLRIDHNELTQLPAVILQMQSLEALDLSYNINLLNIVRDISWLRKLKKLECHGCTSLKSPPFAVCKRGIEDITKYFAELPGNGGAELQQSSEKD